jgi:hypothetical protein
MNMGEVIVWMNLRLHISSIATDNADDKVCAYQNGYTLFMESGCDHPLDFYSQHLVRSAAHCASGAELHEAAARLAWQLHWDTRTRTLALDTLVVCFQRAERVLAGADSDYDTYLTQLRRLAQLRQLTTNALRWLDRSEQVLIAVE